MAPDISIEDIEADPAEPEADETVEFRVKVRNEGDRTADSVGVVIYDEADDPVYVPPNFSVDPYEEQWAIQTGYSSFDAGTHKLRVVVEDHDEETITLSVGDASGWITGYVEAIDDSDVSARVSLDGNGKNQTKLVDSDGEFRFDGLPPGEYEVEIYGSEIESKQQDVWVSNGAGTDVTFGDLTVETYELTVDSEPIDVFIDGEGEYDHLEEVDLDAPREEDGYEFSHWEDEDGDEIWDDNNFDLTMRGDREVVAIYIDPGNPDLAVTEIETASDDPDETDTVSFDVSVENTGEKDAENVELEVSTEDGETFYEDNIDIDEGEDDVIYNVGEWENPDPGWPWITAEINPDRDIDEESYDNNEHRTTVNIEEDRPEPKPDIGVAGIEFNPDNPTTEDEIGVVVEIENTGREDAYDVTVETEIEGSEVDSTRVDIDADEDIEIVATETTLSEGTYTITATAESDVDERNTDNNTDSETISIDSVPTTGEISHINVTPEETKAGTSTSVETDIRNTSEKEAAFDIQWEFDTPNDTYTVQATERIDSNTTTTVTEDWSIPQSVTAGDCDVTVTLSAETGGELDEQTETRAVTITATEASINEITVSPDTASVDEPVTVEATVEATGGKQVRDALITARIDGESIRSVETIRTSPTTVTVGEYTPTTGGSEKTVQVEVYESDREKVQLSTGRDSFDVESVKPEAEITNISITPSEPRVGDEITVTGTVRSTSGKQLSDISITATSDDVEIEEMVSTVPTSETEVTIGGFTPESSDSQTLTVSIYESGSQSRTLDTTDVSVGIESVEPQVTISAVDTAPENPVVDENITITTTVVSASEDSVADSVITASIDGETVETKMDVIPTSEREITVGDITVTAPVENGEVVIEVYESAKKETLLAKRETEITVSDREPGVKDISLIGGSASKTDVRQGESVSITATVANEASSNQSVTVTSAFNAGGEESVGEQVQEIDISGESDRRITTEFSDTGEIPVGDYTPTIVVEVDGNQADEIVIEEGVRVVAPEENKVTDLTVKAFTPTYESVGDVEFTLSGEDTEYSTTETVPESGETISSVPRGTYEWEATSDEQNQTISGEVTLSESVEKRPITFTQATPIRGSVIATGDNTLARDATVHVDVGGDTVTTTTDEKGQFSISENVPGREAEFTVEINPTTNVTKDIGFKDNVTLEANGNGIILPSNLDDAEDTDAIIEQVMMANTNPVITLFLQHPYFKEQAATVTAPTRLIYGALRGFIYGIIETITGIVDTFKSLVKILLNLPEVIGKAIDLIMFAVRNRDKMLSYLQTLIEDFNFPDIDKPQRVANPYDSDGDDTDVYKFMQFKMGWYIGWVISIIASGAGSAKVASRGKAMFDSVESFADGVQRVKKAALVSNKDIGSVNRLTTMIKPTGGGAALRAIGDAPSDVKGVLDDVVVGGHIVNDRTIGAQAIRNRFLENARDIPRGSIKTTKMKEFESVYDKSPRDITESDVDNVFGGVGEYGTVNQITEATTGQFKHITENDVYGALFTKALSKGDDAIVASINLQKVDFSDYVRDGYDIKTIKEDIGLNPDGQIQGEIDFVRVATPREVNGKPVVTRAYERKSGNRITERNTEGKLEHLGKLRALADHPGIDSTKVIPEYGLSLRAFTRARDNDLDVIGGDGDMDFQYITASNTDSDGAITGGYDPDFGGDIPVNREIVRGKHSTDEIRETTKYLLVGKDGESVDAVERRKSYIGFLFDEGGAGQ